MKPYRKTIQKAVLASMMLLIAGFVVFGNNGREAKADINPMVNFSGKVTNTDGSEVADGTYDFSFGLYTSPTGGGAIWSENLTAANRFSGTISSAALGVDSVTYTYIGASATSTFRIGQYLTNSATGEFELIVDYNAAANTVTVASATLWSVGEAINNRPRVEGGVININLGSVSDLSGVDFNQILYLEIVFNGETMQPRKLLAAAAQAFDSAKLGGRAEGELAGLIDDEIISGEWSFENIVNISTSSASTALTVTQNGAGNIVEFKSGTTTAFSISASGQVTIGDYALPSADGAAGYILKTDGSGGVSWQADIRSELGYWATSTDDLFIHPLDTDYVVVIGNNATSSDGYILEVDGNALFNNTLITLGSVGIGTTTPSSMLTVGAALGSQFLVNTAGVVTDGEWHGGVIDIQYGGTGASTATSARDNLDLDEIYKFGITSTGTANWIWQSDGDGRGQWVSTSSLGISEHQVSKLVGTTTATFDGNIASSSLQGYAAANYVCDYEYAGSHFCRTYDILVSIEQCDISSWAGNAWIAEGPPGYTYNSNDCQGWTSNDNTDLGAFWAFDSNGGGMGWLVNCAQVKPIACCQWE